MFHVVEAVEALSSTQSNPVHSFPAQTQQPVMPSNSAASCHKESKVPASSSKQVDTANDTTKSGQDKKDKDSLDSDDEWDNSLLPPVSKEDAVEDAEKQRKKTNLQACYSALMDEQLRPNSSSNALSPNQKPQYGRNTRPNRRRSSPLDRAPVNNYPQDPAYPFPHQVALGNRGRGMRRGGRGGRGGGMEQGRWYGPGTPHRQVEWRDRRFNPEFNPNFIPQFGTISHPPPPYFPSPPHGLPLPMPETTYNLPRAPNVVALTEQTMKNEVKWLSWRIENDVKKVLSVFVSALNWIFVYLYRWLVNLLLVKT